VNRERQHMMIETHQDLETVIARLAHRTPESLAAFIGSLVHDDGPIGEHVRTFIFGDDLDKTIASVVERIDSLRHSNHRHYRHRVGEQVGRRLGYILDSIECMVLSVAPQKAYELLVLLIERDVDVMEVCGDYHDAVAHAFTRAADLVSRATQTLQQHEVTTTLQRLIADDTYGTRRSLTTAVNSALDERQIKAR
jgi:Family of unknown function (DUF6880)